jgi:hypothetical protein
MSLGARRAIVGCMAPEHSARQQFTSWRWFYLPLIVGLIIGATVSSMTDQWWWTTVGVVLGAAIGELSRRLVQR